MIWWIIIGAGAALMVVGVVWLLIQVLRIASRADDFHDAQTKSHLDREM